MVQILKNIQLVAYSKVKLRYAGQVRKGESKRFLIWLTLAQIHKNLPIKVLSQERTH